MKISKLALSSKLLHSQTNIEGKIKETASGIASLKNIPAIINVSEGKGMVDFEDMYVKRFGFCGNLVERKRRNYQSRLDLHVFYKEMRSLDNVVDDIASITHSSDIKYDEDSFLIYIAGDYMFPEKWSMHVSTDQKTNKQKEYYSIIQINGTADDDDVKKLLGISDKVIQTDYYNWKKRNMAVLPNGEEKQFDNPKTILYKHWTGDINKDNIRNFMRDAFLMDNELWITGRYFYRATGSGYFLKKRSFSHVQVDIPEGKSSQFRLTHCYENMVSPNVIIGYMNPENNTFIEINNKIYIPPILPILSK